MPVWRFRGKQLELTNKTAVMGILNVTPDSFSDGGRYTDISAAVEQALRIQAEGAAILDVGGQSTRPGHTPVSAAEEWRRLEPVLAALQGRLDIPISIDTYYTEVAEQALGMGAAIINDVSNSLTNGMPRLCARYDAGLVMMHHHAGQNTPAQVAAYFRRALALAAEQGLSSDHICLDIGIGFQKTQEEDIRLIAALPAICREVDAPVLVGASRKRVVGTFCGNPPAEERLAGTLAIHTAAQLHGAHILRVHDVAAAVQAAAVADAVKREVYNG